MCIHPSKESSDNFVLEIFSRASKPVLFIQSADEITRATFAESVIDTLKDAKDFFATGFVKLDASALLSPDVHGIAAKNFNTAVDRAACHGGGVVFLSNFDKTAAARVNASEVVAQLMAAVARVQNVRFVVSGDTQSLQDTFFKGNLALARRAVTLTVG